MTTAFLVEDRDGTRLLTLTVPGIVVRLLTVLPVLVALAALHRIAPGAAWWPSAILAAMAAVSAEVPDSGAGLVTLGGLVAWWLLATDQAGTGWALLVAACGLVFHVALAHAAAGPPGCAPTTAVVARLAVRCAVVLLVTAAIALVVEVAEEWGEPPTLIVGGTLAIVGALPWLAVRSRSTSPPTAPSPERTPG
ncbi:hypothetical protein F0U44_08920 [Nocardioides humilatus]|uniref:Uncharacterized protein n=1 Tax=Nocardioides humilatus TaxID=2607660 RepID=A0A5B1LCZ2_9ACTN|nr:hypothetical protein [Nocardioides humilatus]KAA1418611.1 hypothetical protein F0U44_08920 [Nocardioides humilatus]